ncbi:MULTISPECIES: cytochrome P450 [Streptomyces]|uniref:Cytochrome P450 n=2 Tax=Streptomyces TaxID=1883 RepID=A0A646K9G9_STRJU|nr:MULTISPECIES: cytochrome P450 [Streptomyces]MQS34984.1 cytochrome P450 [Streptomyces katsurahamanus]MQS98832.1 cytochrome P450 [Streptomyces jumonjinensis]
MTETVAFPQNRTCPYAPPTAYEKLRGDGPLSRVSLYDGRSVWAVTGHALARRLLADSRLSTNRENEAFPVTSERFATIGRRTVALLGVDDPEHNVQRRMLIPGFGLKRIAGLRPVIQRAVDQQLDILIEQGPPAELVSAFALPVPSMVICALLGVPYADHEFFEEQSRALLRGPSAEDTERARELLDDYMGALVDERIAAAGGDGLLDELIARQRAEGALDRTELASLGLLLLIAGHETTANMLSLGVFTLLQHPEHLAELRADPSLTPAAVEELMRFLSVADGMVRVALEDIEVDRGTTIRADDGVVFATSLINRDADAFVSPEDLDWHRSARHHIGFGYGVHQCLGQNLARAEMEIALRSLLVRLPELRLTVPADQVPFKPGDTLQGMVELPVAW